MATQLAWGTSSTILTEFSGLAAATRRLGDSAASADVETFIGAGMSSSNSEEEQVWTDSAENRERQAMAWVSDYVAAQFTMAGTITFAARARESSTSVNICLRGKIFRIPADPTVDGMPIVCVGTRSGEITTSNADYTWTGTPTSTVFKVNDRIGFMGFWHAGTGGGTTTASGSGYINNGGSGNRYVEFTEDIVFSSTPVILNPIRSIPILGQPRPLF